MSCITLSAQYAIIVIVSLFFIIGLQLTYFIHTDDLLTWNFSTNMLQETTQAKKKKETTQATLFALASLSSSWIHVQMKSL